MIVDCALYRGGVRAEESRSLPKIVAAAKSDPDAFVWMGLHNPSDADLVGIARLFGLHPLAVEDVLHAHQRPKLDVYADFLFLVLRTVWWDAQTESVETGEIMVLAGQDYVVTVRHGEGARLSEVRSRLERTGRLGHHGPAAVLHAVTDEVVDCYLDILDEVEDAVEDLEDKVFSERFDDSGRIYRLKREVHEFYRAVAPLAEPMARLAEDRELPLLEGPIRPFFADVRDHVLRARDAVISYDKQLNDIVQAHLSRVTVQQNEDMRKISSWVAIAAIPTMIAGIYGMNFRNMPELHWRFGYPMALLLMLAVCSALWRAFKRSGWL